MFCFDLLKLKYCLNITLRGWVQEKTNFVFNAKIPRIDLTFPVQIINYQKKKNYTTKRNSDTLHKHKYMRNGC